MNEDMSVPGVSGFWAAGDCAAIPDVKSGTGKFYPPTAQHALREGVVIAKNIEATILGPYPSRFVLKCLGCWRVSVITRV